MEELIHKRCCFIGHRKINKSGELEKKLCIEIENLIAGGVDTFYFGSKSEFNNFCHNIVTTLKEKHPHIKRVYVRAEYPDTNENYTDYLLKNYEETYYPDEIRNSGRAVYIKRNMHMINQCLYGIFYCSEDYKPPIKEMGNLPDKTPESGTKIAYKYAIRKKRNIINVAN